MPPTSLFGFWTHDKTDDVDMDQEVSSIRIPMKHMVQNTNDGVCYSYITSFRKDWYKIHSAFAPCSRTYCYICAPISRHTANYNFDPQTNVYRTSVPGPINFRPNIFSRALGSPSFIGFRPNIFSHALSSTNVQFHLETYERITQALSHVGGVRKWKECQTYFEIRRKSCAGRESTSCRTAGSGNPGVDGQEDPADQQARGSGMLWTTNIWAIRSNES